MNISINGQQVGLKVSMWITDANRLQKLIYGGESQEKLTDAQLQKRLQDIETGIQDEPATLWKFTSILFITYKNACRFAKQEATLTIEDFDLWVDETYGTVTGKRELIKLIEEISDQIREISKTEEDVSENGNGLAKKKKQIGMKSIA